MIDPPILVLSKIFYHLNPKERAKFRRVSKTWKWLIDGIRQENLCVCLPEAHWKLGFNERDIFEVSLYESNELKFDFFRKPDTQQKLRRLHVFYDSRSIFPLDFNLFSQLEEVLELHNHLGEIQIEELNLPKLKTLALIAAKFRISVDVNSDHLTNLTLCHNVHHLFRSPVQLKRPELLKFLQCTDLVPDHQEFINLEHLIAVEVRIPLSSFRKLKRLEIYSTYILGELKANRHLFRSDLEVFVNGFRGRSPGYNFVSKGNHGSLHLSEKVFEEISKNVSAEKGAYSFPWRTSIKYRDHSIPDICFDNFFANVGEVHVSVKVNSENLIRFLRATKTVTDLWLRDCSLDQVQFYDQLPSVTTIRRLDISEGSTNIEFGFLLKMDNLNSLFLKYAELPIQVIYRKLKTNWAFNIIDFSLYSDQEIKLFLYAKISERKSNYIRIHQDPFDEENEEKILLDDLIGTLKQDERINKWLL